MENPNIDYAALLMLIEEYWEEFCQISGGEESAELTLQAIKDEGNVG